MCVQAKLTKTELAPEVLTNIDSHGKCSKCSCNMTLAGASVFSVDIKNTDTFKNCSKLFVALN